MQIAAAFGKWVDAGGNEGNKGNKGNKGRAATCFPAGSHFTYR